MRIFLTVLGVICVLLQIGLTAFYWQQPGFHPGLLMSAVLFSFWGWALWSLWKGDTW